jgi:hypothetical protein
MKHIENIIPIDKWKESSIKKFQTIFRMGFMICLCGLFLLSACTSEDADNRLDINSDQPPAFQPAIVKNKTTRSPVENEEKASEPKTSELKNTYLILTKWHQRYPFNKYLPTIDGNRVVAGCVNIAIAQLLYYHRYPLQGQGIVHHQWKNQTLTSVLNRQFYWEKMPLLITPKTPDYAIDELAAFIRDISIMNHTKFGLASEEQSPATFDITRFINHFGFSDEIQQYQSDAPVFFDMINQELDAFRPVLISIQGEPSSHMAIIDGKMDRDGVTLYHINMGWGGDHNRFYDLRDPIVLESKDDQQGLWSPYQFRKNLIVYAPIKPCTKKVCAPINLEPNDKIRGYKIKGLFDTQIDQDRYENILLKGMTGIQGDRGFSNQAFYIHVYNRYHQLQTSFAPESKNNQYMFEPGVYHICASLCQDSSQGNHCFGYSPDKAQYHIHMNTDVISKEERKELLADTGPPVFKDQLTDIILPRGFKEHIVRIDAYHPMGLPVNLSVVSDVDRTGIQACIADHFLVITNKLNKNTTSSPIVVIAESNGIKAQLDFNLHFSGKRVWFGKLTDIPGKFTNQNTQNKHRIILENNCWITGYNGYKKQAFYLAIYDKFGQIVVPPVDQSIEQEFDRDIYEIRTALQKELPETNRSNQEISTLLSDRYQYQKGVGDQYVIHAYCPDFNDDQALLFQDTEDFPPEFQEELNPVIIAEDAKPFTITMDVIDPDGDDITLSAGSDHPDIEVDVKDKTLEIIPHSPGIKSMAKITVTATANDKQTRKEFSIFVAEKEISLGNSFELSGVFANQDDIHFHPVILSGECKISGDNGFSSQAFFTEILDKYKQAVIPEAHHETTNNFDGFYYIKASLTSNSSQYFSYDKGEGDQYTINVSCPDINMNELDIKQMLWLEE